MQKKNSNNHKKGIKLSNIGKNEIIYKIDNTYENSFEDLVSTYKKVILIDLSNLAHICYSVAVWLVNKKVWNGPEEPSKGMVINILKGKLNGILNTTGPSSHIIFVMDSGRGNKETVLNNYKGQRIQREYNPIADVARYLYKQGYDIKYSKGEEADDCIATLAKRLRNHIKVIIMSTDQDLWQLKRKNIEILSIKGNMEKASKEVLNKKYGINRYKDIVKYKVLFGDSSDNIGPILPYLTKKPILEKINEGIKSKKIIKFISKDKNVQFDTLWKEYKNRKSAIKLRDNLNVSTVKSSKSIKNIVRI